MPSRTLPRRVSAEERTALSLGRSVLPSLSPHPLYFEMGSHCVVQDGLKVPNSRYPPLSASQIALGLKECLCSPSWPVILLPQLPSVCTILCFYSFLNRVGLETGPCSLAQANLKLQPLPPASASLVLQLQASTTVTSFPSILNLPLLTGLTSLHFLQWGLGLFKKASSAVCGLPPSCMSPPAWKCIEQPRH